MIRSCAIELLGVVEHRGAAQGQAQAAGGDRRRQSAHRLGALGLGVLAVVRLVDDERSRPLARQPMVVGGDDLVVDDRDLGRARHRPAPLDTVTDRWGSQRCVSRSQPSFIDAGQTTTAG